MNTPAPFPSISDYFALFGAISILMGLLGFIRSKSRASLIAGTLSGLALLASAFVIAKHYTYQPEKITNGYIMGLVVSVLLLGRFLPGFLKSKKFYPAGIMALLSLGGIIAAILGLTHKAI
ncbi:MAG: hypothetical protein JWL81_2047 [Verrucomicrobiales bacterium]|nr:hypothetical protein [Verrucomicrobiales bacterium]